MFFVYLTRPSLLFRTSTWIPSNEKAKSTLTLFTGNGVRNTLLLKVILQVYFVV